jgi:hypothetical protein
MHESTKLDRSILLKYPIFRPSASACDWMIYYSILEPEVVKPDIIETAKNGDIQRMKEIMEHDLTQRDACSPHDGATPLMFAAMTGRYDMAQLLVEKGCHIDKQDTISGWTALMQATYHG